MKDKTVDLMLDAMRTVTFLMVVPFGKCGMTA